MQGYAPIPTSPSKGYGQQKAFNVRRYIRPSPVYIALAILAVLALPLVYTQHSDPTFIPSLFVASSSGSAVPAPSGGLVGVPLTLEARLSHLLARPALEQWEAELPNRHACPMYTFARNSYFFHDGKDEQWKNIGKNDIREYRSRMVDYLRSIDREGGDLVWKEGMDAHVPVDQRRGLILTGGEGKTLQRMRLSLYMLRKVIGSKIPVEIYHFPDELQDEEVRKELETEFDVVLVSAGKRRQDGKSWNIKNVAFLTTKFTEFIYLDSDNIPLRDPILLFDSVEYKQSGSVFWADLNKDHPDNAIFRILGRYCSDEHWPVESGQVIFDKRGNNGLNLAVLHLSAHMMADPEHYDFLSYGDKDTFRYAFYALGLDFQLATKLFASVGGYQTQAGADSNDFCGHSMIQWGLTPQSEAKNDGFHPEPFFLHTILGKHRYNLQPTKLFSHYRRPRLDGIHEPLLVRTLYEFTGDCFAITLKGPDGGPSIDGSQGDGQGVITLSMRDVVGDKVWTGLEDIAETFVNINQEGQ